MDRMSMTPPTSIDITTLASVTGGLIRSAGLSSGLGTSSSSALQMQQITAALSNINNPNNQKHDHLLPIVMMMAMMNR
jgi:hypothetical protein